MAGAYKLGTSTKAQSHRAPPQSPPHLRPPRPQSHHSRAQSHLGTVPPLPRVRRARLRRATHRARAPTQVGDAFPDVAVDIGFLGLSAANGKTTGTLCAGKKTLWVSLPGAFTPTSSTFQVPGLKKAETEGKLEEARVCQSTGGATLRPCSLRERLTPAAAFRAFARSARARTLGAARDRHGMSRCRLALEARVS